MFHILNPFPSLLLYSLLAPVILRLALGYFFIRVASSRFKTVVTEEQASSVSVGWKILGIGEFILGICFILGFGVQVDALIAIILFLVALIFYKNTHYLQKYPKEVIWLLILISVSLLLSGAGLPAIDLPL
jgi:uncharacterized membrane protein YphA (DoxX/SURF4 family)